MCSKVQGELENAVSIVELWYNVNVVILSLVISAMMPVSPLAEAAFRSIDSRIPDDGLDAVAARFVGYPHEAANDSYLLNTNFWLVGVDFSCVSPWNSGGGALRAGTLISPRHIICAKHFPLWKGVRIVFVGQDGNVCPSRIVDTRIVDKSDIMIGLLDYPVTPNIKPAKMLPLNYSKYIGNGSGLPVVTFDQRERATLAILTPIPTNSFDIGLSTRHLCQPKRKLLQTKIVSGDSGNPAFMLIGDQAILLYCVTGGITGAGSSTVYFRAEIQKAMDALCPGYKLECFDFEKAMTK